jgi:hypothetical protein
MNMNDNSDDELLNHILFSDSDLDDDDDPDDILASDYLTVLILYTTTYDTERHSFFTRD